ncbi:transcriptional regulator, LysR family [Methylobacterium sp. 4-46]|uniref:LysR substrate-binding domain-containing protein n=1 Tax=unclassified Methylobacterium TaxID=2615210 RepID=UPI000165CE04|nr:MULTISPECIES: LysR substrate-binding domain-containing protein [Methylobacterium]ACA19833.1 transcriptional regulator, LysR family [Methylobacterium sp. 4-46]WFT79017.1 LysR substrate-binding domain-containing protein [Methylobacterium nodulans]
MKLLYLAAFRAVMLTGTVSAAAEVLGRSQPAVSRLLDKLEAELGAKLFERRRGLVVPTSTAQLLLDEVERAYVSLESLKTFASRAAEGESSRVSAAVLPALGLNFIPATVATFARDWPRTRVLLNVQPSVQVEEWAASQQIDFGVAEMPVKRSGFRTEIFSDRPYLLAVPRDHPLAERDQVGPSDLRGEPFIVGSSFTAMGQLLPQAFRTSGVPLEARYEAPLSMVVYELVKQGVGIGLVDPYTALMQRDERLRLLRFVPTIPFNVALLRPESRPANPAADALLDLMASERDRLMARFPD